MTREEAFKNLVALNAVCGQKDFFDKEFEEALLVAEKALEQQPCEDAISREELLKKQYRIDDSATLSTRDVVDVEDIEDLPSVQPKENVLDKIRAEIEEIEKNYRLDKATKYGNKNAEQQNLSYSTMMMYEVADITDEIKDIIDKYKADKKDCTTCIGFGDKDYAQSFCHDCVKDIQNHYKADKE